MQENLFPSIYSLEEDKMRIYKVRRQVGFSSSAAWLGFGVPGDEHGGEMGWGSPLNSSQAVMGTGGLGL